MVKFQSYTKIGETVAKKSAQIPFLGRMAVLPKNPVKSMKKQLADQVQYKSLHSLNKKVKLPGSPKI
jgi:hypothetical protein